MVDVSAHTVDQVLSRVQHRQWVMSMPRRIRWHMRHKPDVRRADAHHRLRAGPPDD